ncbi:MAG TPA: cytochrome c oxidase subunit 3 [Gemmatimonadales bacterium]|nr:cytochrome c oxidase subunit 3 [Gemmatimonadales bacterium]
MDAVPRPAPGAAIRTGVWLGIAAIAMSFAAYTSALLVRQGGAPDWRHLRLPPLLFGNTVVLLASSATLELGRRGFGRRAPAEGRRWLRITLGLGLLFVAGQVAAWRELAAQGVYLATNPASSFFYVLTGLHALHLLGGITALGYALSRVRGPVLLPPPALDGAALYWHFMDALWLYLLGLLVLRL